MESLNNNSLEPNIQAVAVAAKFYVNMYDEIIMMSKKILDGTLENRKGNFRRFYSLSSSLYLIDYMIWSSLTQPPD